MSVITPRTMVADRIANREERVDDMIDDSFPASDPPATTSAHAGSPRHPRDDMTSKPRTDNLYEDDGLVDSAGWWFFIGGAATALLALTLNAMLG